MQISRVVFYLWVIALCTTSVVINAKEVTQQYKGLTLNAEFQLATGKTISDGVVLITHGALAHRDMEAIIYLRKLLKESGYNTLAINLSLGLNNRYGMYDCKLTHHHRNDDAIDEIGMWVSWLEKQGTKKIILLGHSRGGAQIALYAVERQNDLLQAVVLLAPATGDNTDTVAYQKRYNQALAPLLNKAQQLIKNGQGNTVLEHIGIMTCRDTSATADTFVSYYAQSPRLDTPYLIPKLKIPVLVVVAGDDNIVVGLDRKVAPLVDGKQVQMTVVESADHLFRDLNADDAVEAIDEFLQAISLTSNG